MKIMVFLHGTCIMQKNGIGVSREERVQQVKDNEKSVQEYENYVPVDDANGKLQKWVDQGARIVYLTFQTTKEGVNQDKSVLKKHNFPEGEIYYRQNGEAYAQVAEKVMPDILIEDNCESIGGEIEMTYPHIKPELKSKIKSIVVKEFEGLKNLPDDIMLL